MPRTFICYRRDDTAGYAGRIYDDLVERFGKDHVFMDVDAIEPGVDWVDVIERSVASCDVLLVVIGKRWLSVADDEQHRRLDDPHDYMRLEIRTALTRGIRVIPVLVQGATMPGADVLPDEISQLARRQAQELSDGRWQYDVGQLLQILERIPKRSSTLFSRAPKVSGRSPLAGARTVVVALAVVGVLVAVAGAVWELRPPLPDFRPGAQPTPTAVRAVGQPTSSRPAQAPTSAPAATSAPVTAPTVAVSQLSGTIKIVSSLPRSGPSAASTASIVNAYKMALDEALNKVGGATLMFDDRDDSDGGGWDAAREAANATKAAADPDVMIYLGPYNSGAAKVSIPILCGANLAMLSPSNTYPGLTKRAEGSIETGEPDRYYPDCTRNYARVIPSDELQGAAAASWSKQLGATKAYLVDDAELYGRGMSVAFTDAARKVGLRVVGGPDGVDPKASDYRAVAQKVRQSGADVVFYGGSNESSAGRLWQEIRAAAGSGIRLMVSEGVYGADFLKAAGAAGEGTYLISVAMPAELLTGKGADWHRRYRNEFKSGPDAFAAYAYDSMKVAIDAIQRAGRKDRASIRDALLSTRSVAGALGEWSFTDSGDTTLQVMSGRRIKNQQFDEANAVLIQLP